MGRLAFSFNFFSSSLSPFASQPPIGLSTPAVFKALDLNALSKEDPRHLLESFTTKLRAGQPVPPHHYVNDLEPPAFTCIPELKTIKQRLLVRIHCYRERHKKST